MDLWKRNLIFLSTGVVISAIGFSMVIPFLPMYLTELGLEEKSLPIWTGIIASSSFLTNGLMSPIWGSLADRYGKRIMLVRSGLGMIISYSLMGLVQNHYQLLYLRLLNGLLSGYIPASIMLVATNTPELYLGFALGVIQTSVAVGNIMGPLVGGFSAKILGIRYSFFFAATLIALAVILGFFGTREHIKKTKSKQSILADIKEVISYPVLRRIFLIKVIVQAGLFTIQPTLPLYISEITTKNIEVITGVIFSAFGISTAVGAPLIGRMANINAKKIYINGLWVAALLSFMQGTTSNVSWLGIERFVMGFANAAVTVGNNVLLAQSVSEEIRGRVFGVLNTFTAMGFIGGPLIGGFLGSHLGLSSPFYGGGILMLLAALLLWAIPNIHNEKAYECAK
ncbi:MAG: transporter, family, multidrug resistance protein [Clostridia bacterium]|nr:transporter, family, multidrug resistance protein [Clostridia bacterium]